MIYFGTPTSAETECSRCTFPNWIWWVLPLISSPRLFFSQNLFAFLPSPLINRVTRIINFKCVFILYICIFYFSGFILKVEHMWHPTRFKKKRHCSWTNFRYCKQIKPQQNITSTQNIIKSLTPQNCIQWKTFEFLWLLDQFLPKTTWTFHSLFLWKPHLHPCHHPVYFFVNK